MENETSVCHNAFIYNRKRIEISGVSDVTTFTDTSVEAEYAEGCIAIEGAELRIEEFSGETGKLIITGCINGFYYFGKAKSESRGFFRRR